MAATVDVRATGIKEALRELNSIDKRLRKEITAEYQQIVQPMVSSARQLMPTQTPMSGWNRSWAPGGRGDVLPRNWTQERTKVKAYVNSKRPSSFGGRVQNLAVFGMRWNSRAAVLFDMSDKSRTRSGAQMVATLFTRFGAPSRVMWRAYEKADSQVQYELQKLVNKVMVAVGRRI